MFRSPERAAESPLNGEAELRKENQNGGVPWLQKDRVDAAWNEITPLKGPLLLDIVPLVIDQLRYDRSALGTCGLVCRDWLHFSRPHLFERIDYSALDDSDPWSSDVDLLGIFCNQNCTMFPYVRTIGIDGTALVEDAPEDGWGIETESGGCVDDFLCHIHKFKSLTTIALKSMGPDSLDPMLASLTNVRHGIIDVVLDGSLFKTLHDFTSFIAIFPFLKTLSIQTHQDSFFACSSQSDSTQPPPTLRELRITNSYDSGDLEQVPFDTYVLLWLLDVGYSNLDTMEISVSSRQPMAVDALCKYLTFLGPSLKNLKLSGWGDTYAAAMSIPLAEHTNLRHVHILCWKTLELCDVLDTPFYIPIPWISLISNFPLSIESITIELSVIPHGPAYYFALCKINLNYDWAPLDLLLSGGQFPVLKKLIFRSDDQVKKIWPRLLPLCARKQILTVE